MDGWMGCWVRMKRQVDKKMLGMVGEIERWVGCLG